MRDTGKIIDALSKIINTMKDLEKLANDHNIQSKLYSGDGLERIYQLLGDSRVTRWLSIVCEEAYTDEELWLQLIEFLEKDLKVQHQKLLIQGNTEEGKKTKGDEIRQSGRSHFTENSNIESKCFFCDESEDHVATNGPRGTKIVQYFACRKFVEMSPNERFEELSRRGYCFQCLQERIKGSTTMGCVKEILSASTNHMTGFQRKSMCWYVMNIEMTKKIKIYCNYTKIDAS